MADAEKGTAVAGIEIGVDSDLLQGVVSWALVLCDACDLVREPSRSFCCRDECRASSL